MTGMGIYSVEGNKECRAVLASPNFYVKPDASIAHSMNTDTVKFLMAGMTSAPKVAKESLDLVTVPKHLVTALSSYIGATDYDLADKLSELAQFMRDHTDVPEEVTVYRGFKKDGTAQNTMGSYAPLQEGEIIAYRTDAKLVSTSADPSVAESYGENVIEIRLSADKHNYLVITPELYALCASLHPAIAEKSKEVEILVIPPSAFEAKVLRADRSPNPAREDLREDLRGNLNFVESKTAYQEEDSTFSHFGVEYDLNKIFRMIAGSNLTPAIVPMKDLAWNLQGKCDPARVKRADTSVPMIAVKERGKYYILDGNHRLRKLDQEGASEAQLYLLPPDMLKAAYLRERSGDHEFR